MAFEKKHIAVLVGITLFVSICIIEFGLYRVSYNENMKESERILKIAYNLVDNSNNSKKFEKLPLGNLKEAYNKINTNNISNEPIANFDKEEVVCADDIIGILEIKKLQIEAPIKDGTSQEVMKTSVGHFIESDYWNGNVSLASHNGGTSAHYFEKINELSVDDEIKYITKLGTKVYKVQSMKRVEDTDWSMVVKEESQSANTQNTITLVTCINGQPNYRLCVRGIEI
ncbi:MAG: class D sortase [Clostridia bacterium]|nr:class D sortase [Clostridia bacterium]